MISNDRFRMLPTYHYEDATDETLLKSVGKPLRDYRIEGNSVQEGYENLWIRMPEQTKNGVTLTIDRMGVYHLNGTCTTAFNFELSVSLLPVGVYCLTDFATGEYPNDLNSRVQILGYDSDSNIVSIANTANTDNSEAVINFIVIDEMTKIVQRIRCSAGHTYNDCILKPTLIAGSEIPKPSPSNPIEIESVGEKSVNLFNGEIKNLALSYNGTHQGIVSNTTYRGFYVKVESGKTYSVSRNKISSNRFWVAFTSEMPVVGVDTLGAVLMDNNALKFEGILAPDGANYLFVYLSNADEDVSSTNYQVQEGDAATEYEPYGKYKIPVIVSHDDTEKIYNIFLDEPLRKVGDYADYVDFKNGKVVRYVRTMNLYELDDRYVIKNYTYGNNFDNTYHFNCYIVSASNLEDICVAKTDMYCNILPAGNLGINYLETDSFFTSLYTAARYPWYAQIEKALIDSYSGDTIVDKFKAFLTDKKAELYYCRQNYGETPISLPKILTEKSTNIITIGTKLQPSIVTYQYYKGGK